MNTLPFRRVSAAVLAGIFSVATCTAAIILVPEDQPTIQECVDAAVPGDECSIAPGIYYEDLPVYPEVGGVKFKVLVDKPITIRSRELFQAVLDGHSSDEGISGFGIQANAHLEGLIIRNVEAGVLSRGNLDEEPISWSASNLIIVDAYQGIGLDETGLPGETQSSSATIVNATVDARDVCYWTNDAGTLNVRNSIAVGCTYGLEGCNHTGFDFDYGLMYGVQTIRRETCPGSLPFVGPGFQVADPEFLPASVGARYFPYLPRCTSPAIDAGDPSSAYDDATSPPSWGGSRNDVGGYGGPGAGVALTDDEMQYLAGQTLLLQPDGLDTMMGWCSPPGTPGFDIIRGDLAALMSSGGDFGAATAECVFDNHPTNTFQYFGDPLVGQGFWFLVRCEGCPGTGTYDSGAPSQLEPRDAEVIASGQDCP